MVYLQEKGKITVHQAKQATDGHPTKKHLAKITVSGKGRLVKRLAPTTPALF